MTGESILLVDDDPAAIQLMARILADFGPLRFATNGEDALRLTRESPPDLVLLDAEMPGMSGFRVCETLKADPALADVAVIFVTSHKDPEFEITSFDLGAADFISKPVSAVQVLARVRAQLRTKQRTDELRRISRIDALTGVANRRSFDEALQREWLRALRSGEPLALLMVDVDHFKAYNEHYGHPGGDACLRAVAEAIASICQRPGDLVARYGGEEFALLLPHTQRAGALHLADRVLDAVAALGVAHAGSPLQRLSVSVGVGCYDADSACWLPSATDTPLPDAAPRSAADLLRNADLALYAAKHAGRARAWLLDVAAVDAAQAIEVAGPTATGRG